MKMLEVLLGAAVIAAWFALIAVRPCLRAWVRHDERVADQARRARCPVCQSDHGQVLLMYSDRFDREDWCPEHFDRFWRILWLEDEVLAPMSVREYLEQRPPSRYSR